MQLAQTTYMACQIHIHQVWLRPVYTNFACRQTEMERTIFPQLLAVDLCYSFSTKLQRPFFWDWFLFSSIN